MASLAVSGREYGDMDAAVALSIANDTAGRMFASSPHDAAVALLAHYDSGDGDSAEIADGAVDVWGSNLGQTWRVVISPA